MSKPDPIEYKTNWCIDYSDDYFDDNCHYRATVTYRAKVNEKTDSKYETHYASTFEQAKTWIEKELGITI